MYAFLRGEVSRVTGNSVVLDVNGVGYLLSVTPQTLSGLRLGSTAQLAVSMIVREDAMTLFGFVDESERQLFDLLQTVTGIGPKLALTIIAATDPASLSTAIATGDENALVRIPGVGRKSAARLILELKDKFTATVAAPVVRLWQDDVESALVSLGWSLKESQAAIAKLDPATVDASDPGSALRQALQLLNRSGR